MARFNDNDLLVMYKALEWYSYEMNNFTYGDIGGFSDREDAYEHLTEVGKDLNISDKEITNMTELDETAKKILNSIGTCKMKIVKKIHKDTRKKMISQHPS